MRKPGIWLSGFLIGNDTVMFLQNPRAEIYQSLAESLMDPPEWLAYPVREWPLFKAAVLLGQTSPAAQKAVVSLTKIGAESLEVRQKRYKRVFLGPGRPQLWLYESMHFSGRIFGPESLAVDRVYKAAGIEIDSAELPDHAAMELAFLAHTAEQQFLEPKQARLWAQLEKRFIRQHAGRWLPRLGHKLAAVGDEIYTPIGQLLADWIHETTRPPQQGVQPEGKFPLIPQPDDCNLCSFCVQVCPTHALSIRETQATTTLLLSPNLCVGCARCSRICQTNALVLEISHHLSRPSKDQAALRQSPRAYCPVCHQPTISQAELDYVSAKIGNTDWLHACLSCRAAEMENRA